MVTLQRWSVYWKENGHVTEVVTLMEGEWSCYRSGHFNGAIVVVTEVNSLIQGKRSCYRGGHFNGGRMVTLQKWSL